MPELIVSQSGSGPASLPAAAFQAPIKILKRNASSNTTGDAASGSSTAASQSAQTYSEREARYHAARQRIFADAGSEGGKDKEKAGNSVVRQPLGPGEDQANSTGFAGGRRARKDRTA